MSHVTTPLWNSRSEQEHVLGLLALTISDYFVQLGFGSISEIGWKVGKSSASHACTVIHRTRSYTSSQR